MVTPPTSAVVDALLAAHGQTYAAEIGFDASRNSPSPLFRLLCAALLFSARISSRIAVAAAKALARQGWTTPDKLAQSTWGQRAKVLNEAGYARYDERTATMLGETTDILLDRYDGDLRRLRGEADRDPATERRLLKQFKGIGDVGVDIFFREVQAAWEELYPFADPRALEGAAALGLGDDAGTLSTHVARKDFPRLVAACVRVAQEDGVEEVLRAAAGESGDRGASDGGTSGGGGGGRGDAASGKATKAELYDRARALGIAGRSKMRKQELADAVAAAE